MSEKEYSNLEQKLYKTPEQEVAFLSGAFQMVAAGGITIGAGFVPGLISLILMDKYFVKPYREDKDLSKANFRGMLAGLAVYFAVSVGLGAEKEVDTSSAVNAASTEATQITHLMLR